MQAMANGSSSAVIQNSLRFRSSASAYLSRTPATASNRTTWTWSGWVKRGTLTTASNTGFFAGYFDINNRTELKFTTTDLIEFLIYNAGAVVGQLITTQVFRDPSAWYHIVAVMNTGNATGADRMRLYINGSQVTAFSSTTTPAQNTLTQVNNILSTQALGRNESATEFFDGYLAEVNFVDGQALTPSSFGQTNSVTGVWQPIPYSGTYGTNGYYLPFSNIALTSGSNIGLGQDFSGNGNYYNTTNISVTAGVTYDAMKDVPTLTSATVANYAVMNPVATTTASVLIDGNLKTNSGDKRYYSSIGISSGKWYWEYTIVSTNIRVGIANDLNIQGATYTGLLAYGNTGVKWNAATSSAYGASYTTNDVIGVALDMDAGTVEFYKNNTSQGVAFTGLTGTYYASIATGTSGNTNINFGQRPFSYTPPTGYVAINTFNLPDSTIINGASYMDATIWSGNSSSPRSITNTYSFKPDFVWIKNRTSSLFWHQLFDSIRGVGARLASNTTNAEVTNNVNGYLSAFNSNGFSITTGSTNADDVNTTGYNYVGWQWQAGMGSTSTNTNGSITSTVSVNQAVGFSIVTYTGTGLSATVGHGLGTTPKILIIKNRSAVTDWPVFTSAFDGSWDFFYLNLTNAKADAANTPPTSLVFTESGNANQGASGNNYVAYCWAEIAGFSKFGSYTGNGSTNGLFIYTGFRPKFVLYKNGSAAADWVIWDTTRNPYNVVNLYLLPNSINAEGTSANLDILSNGFKLRIADATNNASGNVYIYMAFAENPFKNALAR